MSRTPSPSQSEAETPRGEYVGLDQGMLALQMNIQLTSALKEMHETQSSNGVQKLIRVVDEEKRKIQQIYEKPCKTGQLTPEATEAFKGAVREGVRNLARNMVNFTEEKNRDSLRKMIDDMKETVRKMKEVEGIYEPMD